MAAAALAAAAAVYALVRRERRVHAALVRERAASRLTAGQMGRDLEAFHRRVDAVLVERAVLAEADRVVARALVYHAAGGQLGGLRDLYDPFDPNSTEGGPV